MPAYDEAVNCLKQMHSIVRENNLPAYNLNREQYRSLNTEERRSLERNIKFMREEEWIIPHTLCSGFPVSYSLTSKGIKIAEDINENQVIKQTTYNIGTAQNSIVGDNTHNNTINIGSSFEELMTLIEEKISCQNEKNKILEVLLELQNNMSSNKALEKGTLTKISDKLESCSWLSSGIASLVLQYLTSLAGK